MPSLSTPAFFRPLQLGLVAFGRPFIAKPGLPARLATGHARAPSGGSTLLGGDRRGYTDYPALATRA